MVSIVKLAIGVGTVIAAGVYGLSLIAVSYLVGLMVYQAAGTGALALLVGIVGFIVSIKILTALSSVLLGAIVVGTGIAVNLLD